LRISDFCTRVEIAFRAGGESISAATATYDLPAQRRVLSLATSSAEHVIAGARKGSDASADPQARERYARPAMSVIRRGVPTPIGTISR
jgi:hypothetical protein